MRAHDSNTNYKQDNRDSAKSEVILTRANEDVQYGNDSTSSSEEVFDERSSETFGTSTTKEDIASKTSQKMKQFL